MNDIKKNELNEQELNQVSGGGIIQDVKDLLQISKTVAEMITKILPRMMLYTVRLIPERT